MLDVKAEVVRKEQQVECFPAAEVPACPQGLIRLDPEWQREVRLCHGERISSEDVRK